MMPDKTKVISELENYEPYAKVFSNLTVEGSIILDALTLLREQDAVEPINSYGTFRCGNCENIVGYNDDHGRGYQNNFCSKCGKAVKWE